MDARRALLDWYRPRRHAYPWRASTDPYGVLVSEVMLQQTGVSRVVASYAAFIRRFPTVVSLSEAPRSEVLRAWEGLGYNRRAVALSKAARAIVSDHGGGVPASPRTLAGLPGIGPYSAAAIASVAYGAQVAAVDTSARRVIARALLGAEPAEVSPARVRETAAEWLSPGDPGAWNQAVMDLGREMCRPVPRCSDCPLQEACRFRKAGRRTRPGGPGRQAPSAPFGGSSRQVRGRVVAVLRREPSSTLGRISELIAQPVTRVAAVVVTLAADGLVEGDSGAAAGHPAGRVRLAE